MASLLFGQLLGAMLAFEQTTYCSTAASGASNGFKAGLALGAGEFQKDLIQLWVTFHLAEEQRDCSLLNSIAEQKVTWIGRKSG